MCAETLSEEEFERIDLALKDLLKKAKSFDGHGKDLADNAFRESTSLKCLPKLSKEEERMICTVIKHCPSSSLIYKNALLCAYYSILLFAFQSQREKIEKDPYLSYQDFFGDLFLTVAEKLPLFDPEKAQLSTFFGYPIHDIVSEASRSRRGGRDSRALRKMQEKIKVAIEELKKRGLEDPSVMDIVDCINVILPFKQRVSPRSVISALATLNETVSMDAAKELISEDFEIADLTGNKNPEEIMLLKEKEEEFKKAIESLPPKHKIILLAEKRITEETNTVPSNRDLYDYLQKEFPQMSKTDLLFARSTAESALRKYYQREMLKSQKISSEPCEEIDLAAIIEANRVDLSRLL